MPGPSLRLLLGFVALTTVAACAGGAHRDAAPPAPTRSAAVPSSSGSGGVATPSCPTAVHVRVTDRRATVLYALRFTIDPGGRSRGQQDATLYTYPAVSPGVYVGRPRGGRPQQRLTDAVLERAPQGSPFLAGLRGLVWDVHNDSATSRRYLAYAGASVYRGRWSAEVCRPVRHRVTGTLVVVGRVRDGVVGCRSGVAGTALRDVATRTACERDTAEARPFRTPSG